MAALNALLNNPEPGRSAVFPSRAALCATRRLGSGSVCSASRHCADSGCWHQGHQCLVHDQLLVGVRPWYFGSIHRPLVYFPAFRRQVRFFSAMAGQDRRAAKPMNPSLYWKAGGWCLGQFRAVRPAAVAVRYRGRRRDGRGFQMDAGHSISHRDAVKAGVGHAARKRRKQARLLCAYLVKRRGQKRCVGRLLLGEFRDASAGRRVRGRLAVRELCRSGRA